jgi:hypothetical protein
MLPQVRQSWPPSLRFLTRSLHLISGSFGSQTQLVDHLVERGRCSEEVGQVMAALT